MKNLLVVKKGKEIKGHVENIEKFWNILTA